MDTIHRRDERRYLTTVDPVSFKAITILYIVVTSVIYDTYVHFVAAWRQRLTPLGGARDGCVPAAWTHLSPPLSAEAEPCTLGTLTFLLLATSNTTDCTCNAQTSEPLSAVEYASPHCQSKVRKSASRATSEV